MESGQEVRSKFGVVLKDAGHPESHETNRLGPGRDCSPYLSQIPKAQKRMPCNFEIELIFFTKEMFCFNFKSF